jgi:fibronectin-binding autotransporter adhesin
MINTATRLQTAVAIAGLSISAMAATQSTSAAVLTWTSANNGPAVDGSGTWGTASTWWNNSSNVAWQSAGSDTALFGAAGGSSAFTVTISGSQSVGSLTFQSQAYTLAGASGTLSLSGSASVFTVNAGGGTIAAVVAGSSGLTKAGSGMLTLAAANTYSGSTTVSGGTLQLNSANGSLGALASPIITVNSGAMLALSAADVLGFTSSREALIINGGTVSNTTTGGRVTLENAVTMMGGLLTGPSTGDYGGAFSFDSAAGIVATSDFLGNPAVVKASSISGENHDISFNVTRGAASSAYDLVVRSAIVPFNVDANGITKTGNGILTLTGSNTYTGPTAISGGTLVLGDGGTTGSILPSGSIANNATVVFNRSDAVVQGTDFGLIGGAGGVVQLGTGVLILNASNTYTGATIVACGTLSASLLADAGGASAIGRSSADSSHLVLNSGGVFQYTGSSIGISRGFTVGSGGAAIDVAAGTQLNLSGTPVLNAALTKVGGGTLQLTNYSGSTISGSGAIVLNQGTLDFGSSYFGGSPFGYRALNIQVNPGGDLSFSAPHALGGGTNDIATSWGVVRVLGGTMTLAREQYISGGTVNSLGRLILQGGTIINSGSGELRATANTSYVSTLASAQASTINVRMSLQYGSYVFDVADGPASVDLLIAGNLSGPNGITKTNAGKMVLSGSNSYTTATVAGGILLLANSQAIADGTNLTIGDGSRFVAGPIAAGSIVSGPVATPVPEAGSLSLVFAAGFFVVQYGILRRRRGDRN